MRNSPGHFMPCLGFLGAQHFTGIFQDHDVAGRIRLVRRQRGNRQSQMQDLARPLDVQLACSQSDAASAFHQVAKLSRMLGWKQLSESSGALHLIGGKQAAQRAIHTLDAAAGCQRDHTCGNALENGFGKAAAALQLAAVVLQAVDHLIESAHQRCHFIVSGNVHAMPQVAFPHLTGRIQERRNRHADLLG